MLMYVKRYAGDGCTLAQLPPYNIDLVLYMYKFLVHELTGARGNHTIRRQTNSLSVRSQTGKPVD